MKSDQFPESSTPNRRTGCRANVGAHSVDSLTNQYAAEVEKPSAMPSGLQRAEEVPEWMLQIAHELSTPLSTVLLSLDMLHDGLDSCASEEVWRSVTHVVRRQQSLLRSLLTIARHEQGYLALTPEPVDMAQAAHAVAVEYGGVVATKQLQFTLSVDAELPLVAGNDAFVSAVIANLVDNAVKYTPPGGTIGLRVYGDDHGFFTECKDSGPGIQGHEFESLFSPFYRSGNSGAHQAVPGTGIGLFLVKRLVRCMGGCVDVDSVIGAGTTFTVWLPSWSGSSAE